MPSQIPGSDDRLPGEHAETRNHNNPKDEAPRVATEGLVIAGDQRHLRRGRRRLADIFVSYTSNDRDWAFWIAQELEKRGHTPHIHEWEISAGGNIAAWMEERKADHILCVISKVYLTKAYSSWERQAAQWAAASERPNFALPVFVEDCKAPTMLAPFKRCELFGLSEVQARRRLAAYLHPSAKPTAAVPFPAEGGQVIPEVTQPKNAPFPGNKPILSETALAEPVRQMAKILNDFSVNAKGLIALKAESAPQYRDEYLDRYDFVPETVARLKFEEAIHAYCEHVHDQHFWGGDGMLSDPPEVDEWRRPDFAGAVMVPLQSWKMALGGTISDLLSATMLCFSTTVFVLPYEIRSQSLSYSGPAQGRTSWPALEELLLLNKLHETAVASGLIVFLPRKYVSELETAKDYSVTSLESPGRQPAGEMRLLPLNPVNKAKRRKDAIRFPVYASIDVPFFRTLAPQDIGGLPENVLAPFRRFGRLLAENLTAAAAATSTLQFRQGLDSLRYASANLRAEAEMIWPGLPNLARFELATIRIEVTALTEGETKSLSEPPGVLASPYLGIPLLAEGRTAVRQPEPGALYFAILLGSPTASGTSPAGHQPDGSRATQIFHGATILAKE